MIMITSSLLCVQPEKLLYYLCKDALHMSTYSEDDVRRAAEIREWLVKQISDRQDEIEKLRTTLSLVDNLLKHGSFKAASALSTSYTLSPIAQSTNVSGNISTQTNQQRDVTRSDIAQNALPSQQRTDEMEFRESRSLKRLKDNLLLAHVEISGSTVEISPAEGINLNINTPPFKSFFLNRILEGMKTKDIEKVNNGQIKESELLNYQIDEDNNGLIKRIIINNYRENDRLNEIFNTSAWVFTRMVEKAGR
jgi:hypothetical protein